MARLVLEPRPLGPESSAPTILPPPLWVQSHSDHLSGWYCFGYSWNFYSSIQLDCWWTSAANEWDVELNTRREIPYLQATIYYSLFNIHLDFGPLLVSVSMIVYPYFGTNYYNSIAIIPAYSDLAIRKGYKIGKSSSSRFSFSAASNAVTKVTKCVTFGFFFAHFGFLFLLEKF